MQTDVGSNTEVVNIFMKRTVIVMTVTVGITVRRPTTLPEYFILHLVETVI